MLNFKSVLVAATEIGTFLVEKLLSGKATVIRAKDLAQAIVLANKDIDLIVCDINFADSRMFEFLRAIKANAKTNSIPFLCFNAVHTNFSEMILGSVDTASKSLGAIGFIDFWVLAEKHGVEEAEIMFQDILIDSLTTGSREKNSNQLSVKLGG